MLQQLAILEVQSSLTCAVKISGQFVGLLMIHQCREPRIWQERELDFLEQVKNQMVFALDRLDFWEQQKDAEIQAKQAKSSKRFDHGTVLVKRLSSLTVRISEI